MIAIPNMEKPKRCLECWSGLAITITCEAGTSFHNPDGDLIPPDCPLIEIVTCSECNHLEVINGAKIYAHCPMWEIDFKPFEDDTRTNYCSWGERRADDHI